MFGSNVKVHFAGSDNSMPHTVAANLAGVNYSLFTCYPFIKGKRLDDDFTYGQDKLFVPRIIQGLRNHIIMDSGLFTLMFGADKGKPQTLESLTLWQDKTAKFIKQNGLTCSVVEIDCQKILGVEQAWYFRNRMRTVMPNNRHINVFHLPDGMKGLDRLIEFSDYIAFSVPELRISRRGTYREDLRQLVYYTKNRKPEIDIHLLGCTEKALLQDNKFCSSADSTSWLSANRYGRIGYKKYHVDDIKKTSRERVRGEILREFGKYQSGEITEKTMKYTQDAYFSACISKRKYEEICGNQD